MASRISDRKTKLTLVTNATVRYRGRERAVVIEVYPDYADVRLLGTRLRYSVSWRGVHDLAARIFADRQKAERKASRKRVR
jgi:hypothetical protein